MISYSVADVDEITAEGIKLNNGKTIDFDECVKNYYKQFDNNVKTVGFVDTESKELYIEFYTEEPIRIYFNREKKFFLRDQRNREEYDDFLMQIREFQYYVNEL